MKRVLAFLAIVCLAAIPLAAQSTGSISGVVTAPGGDALPGVLVEASGDVLPKPVTTITDSDGAFRFPVLPPGNYDLKFKLEGLGEQKRSIRVLLDTNSTVLMTLAAEAVQAEINVVEAPTMIDGSSAEIKDAIGREVFEAVPVGEDYRDLQKLIPGVQYSENLFRGPSAGGSGQDNVYLYDGVNVGLPLFGTLSAEPSTHDVDQISIIRGGAKALDFNRSSGFTMDSISKSGTNKFRGEVSYRYQPQSLRSDSKDPAEDFDEDRDWSTVSGGGPIVRDHLFFYASYFRPTIDRDNGSNAYGSVPKFESTRDEWFGRLSFQPTANLVFHGSYRDSDRNDEHADVLAFESATASQGQDASLEIGILEGNWIINTSGFASFKVTDFENKNAGIPDHVLGFSPNADGSVPLDIAHLDTQGRLNVPILRPGETAYNAFVTPYIQQYGYLQNGVPTGGGFNGVASQVEHDDFFRKNWQVAYDWLGGSNVSHDVHFGYQWYRDEEDLDRHSNGWGNIQVLGGRITSSGKPVFFQATPLQTGVIGLSTGAPKIHSELESQNFEINDTIQWSNWSFNVGAVVSNDQLFGQGLRAGGNLPSGFELCATCKYKMYEVDWSDQIQPRLGAVWSYGKQREGTVFANFARYNPAASSLPRAASWARNNATTRLANFDATGHLIDIQALSSSTGKFFQPGLDPRTTDEYLLGTTRDFGHFTVRLNARHRRSYNFWEDTNNNARQFPDAPSDISHDLYIPNLTILQTGIGGSSYVIAELDNAFTKYYEAAPEVEWRGAKSNVRASYVWSHYYGNFDQDNTSGDFIDNDTISFIGSSNIADGPGRQLWNFKYGDLHGDKRHQVKLYGYHQLDWNASIGAFAIYQSGTPWETWNVEFYRFETTSTSNTIRFSEPAGSHRSSEHYQLDLNYTQNFDLGERFVLSLLGDVFNVFDQQTGYAIQPVVSVADYGRPTEYFDPRRFRLTARLRF